MDPAIYRKGSLAVIVTPAPQMQTGALQLPTVEGGENVNTTF